MGHRQRPVVWLVTDRTRVAPTARTTAAEIAALEAQIDEAAWAGVDAVQVRERDLEARDLVDLVTRIRERAAGSRARIYVNDRADVARLAGAHGVHLRDSGPDAARVRGFLPEGGLVSRSIHHPPSAWPGTWPDWLVFGTVYPTVSKPGDAPVAGIAGLAAAVEHAPVPVVAIGGVTVAGARACVDAGARGVAAIGVFLPAGVEPGALGPAAGVRALRDALGGTGT